MKISLSLNKISQISLYLLVILVPLWYLPITQNILDYQKQAILAVLVFLGITSWLAHAVSKHELTFRMTWLHIPVVIFVALSGISAYFSLWPYASVWGFPLSIADSFMTIFAFSLLYFLIVSTIQNVKHLGYLLLALVASGTLASIFALLQLKGVFSFIPLAVTQVATLNTIGSPNAVAVFAAVLFPLALALVFIHKGLTKGILWAIVFSLFSVVALINFSDAWITLVVGLFALLIFGVLNAKRKTGFGWASFVMAFVSVALFLFVFNISIPGAPATPLEVSPSQGATLSIALNVIKEHPIVGSGPGTFIFDYARFHSASLNQTIFWGTRFASGSSAFLEGVATRGLLGTFAYVALVGTAIYLIIKNIFPQLMLTRRLQRGPAGGGDRPKGKSWLNKLINKTARAQSPEGNEAGTLQSESLSSGESSDNNWMIHAGIFSSFIAILTAQFLYPANFTFWFLFWVLLGGLGIVTARAQNLRSLKVDPTSRLAFIFSFAFLLFIIFGLGFLFIGSQKYIAEIRYREALVASANGDLDGAINKLLSAVNLNSSIDLYWRDLSQLYLLDINRISVVVGFSDEERINKTQIALINATTSARAAVAVAPANVANWNVQGFVYRNLVGIEGAENFAVEAYKKATELEPASPFSWTELARVYVVQAATLEAAGIGEEAQNEAYDKALESLNRAIELKEDYSSAHYLSAVIYLRQGRTAEAIAKLAQATILAPRDVGLAFQLGVMYWQADEITKAQTEFERAKRVNPNYSNARYMLGLVYDRRGQAAEAKAEFEAVVRLNPDNLEVARIVKNLEEGKPALAGITPSEPPIEETPSEIDIITAQ